MALHWHIYHLLEAGDVDDARAREPRAGACWPRSCASRRTCTSRVRWETMWAMLADRQEETQALIMRAYEIGGARAGAGDRHRGRRPAARGRLAPRRAGPVRRAARGPGAREPAARRRTCRCWRSAVRAGGRPRRRARPCSPRIDIDALARDMLWMAGMCVLSQVCVLVGDVDTRPGPVRAAAAASRAQRDGRHGQLHGARRSASSGCSPRCSATPSPPRSTSTPRSRATPRAASTPMFDDGPRRLRGDARGPRRPGDALRAAQLRAETLESTGEATQIAPPAPTQRATLAVRVTRTPHPLDGPGSLRVIPNGAKAAQARTSIP